MKELVRKIKELIRNNLFFKKLKENDNIKIVSESDNVDNDGDTIYDCGYY